MNKYEIIEKYRLYYFKPSYWRKLQRRCHLCNVKYKKDNKVQFGIAFDKDRKLFHENCLKVYLDDNSRSRR